VDLTKNFSAIQQNNFNCNTNFQQKIAAMASVGTSLVKSVTKASGMRKLLLGQIHPCQVPKAKKVVVKQLEFDDWLKMVLN
jgi:hypothetical protein